MKQLERMLFRARYILVPFYVITAIGLLMYLMIDVKEIIHSGSKLFDMTEEEGTLMILSLLDILMIASIAKMMVTGGYTTFVNKNAENAEKTSSGVLKVKLATSLIGVGMIHLAQNFLNAEDLTMETIQKKIAIFAMFIIASLSLAVIDYLHVKSEAIHHEDCEKHHIKEKH